MIVDFLTLIGEISEDENAAGRGMLSAFSRAEGQYTARSGFYELAKKLRRDTKNKEEFWINEVQKVCASWPKLESAAPTARRVSAG